MIDVYGVRDTSVNERGVFGLPLANPETPVFDLKFPYGVNADQVVTATANGGTVTGASGFAVLSSSTATNGTASLESRDILRYVSGQGAVSKFTTIYTQGAAQSTQEHGIGDDTDGFFFGFNGASFGVCVRNNSVSTWTPQASWNGDQATWLDPTKLNVYRVRYQWLGGGPIEYFVEHPDGGFVLVHRVRYPNSAVVTSVRNPSFPLRAAVTNAGNASNIVLKTPSMGAYVEGPLYRGGLARAYGATVTGITTTETPIFSLRNNTTFNSARNRVRALIEYYNAVNQESTSARDLVLAFRVGVTGLTPTPTWAAFSTWSVCDLSTNSTTMTPGSGTLLFRTSVSQNADRSEIIRDLEAFWRPGEVLTVCAFSLSSTVNARIGMRWKEEF